MSLMKWFRKNNRKIIAVAVVGLLVVWLGGSALRMTCGYAGPRQGKAVALFGRKNKITIADISRANNELTILRQMRAEYILRSHDIHGILLAELLFSESRLSPALIASLRQTIQTNRLRISNEQIHNLYRKTQRDEIYWHLLKKEAESAGIAISNESIANMLRQAIPKLFEGSSYAQVINSFLSRGISEETILSAFSSLYSVLEYATITCSSEALTRAQISQLVNDELQTMNAQLVRVHAELFTDEQDEPDDSQIQEQFEKYKAYYPGEVTQDNPYGFGYKLDDRVQLDYIIVKLDEVEKIIDKPTQQEKEQYYLIHSNEFVEERPSDPNDPNSLPLQYTMSFGQVARLITNRMTNERIIKTTQAILSQARQLTEEKYGDNDAADLTAEQLKDLAVDYDDIANQLAEEYSVNISSGRTGLLGITDIQQDENINSLLLRPAGLEQMPYGLIQLVFSVEPFDSTELIFSDTATPKIYQTIGPLFDLKAVSAAIIRVVDVQKAAVPESPDVTFSSAGVKLEQSDTDADDEVYSVREQVVKDLKILAAMRTTKEKAEKFLAMAQKDGWEKAIDSFNRQYPTVELNEPNNFELAVLMDLKKPSPDTDEALATQNQGLVGSHLSMNTHKRDKMIIDELFSLVPDDSNTPKELPVILEVRPDLSYYCIKDLSINRITSDQYEKVKTLIAFRQNNLEGQSLSAIHFEPENILSRTNFRVITESQPPDEPNEPASETAKPPQES